VCDVCTCPHTLQGINLHLIGAVGSGHDGSQCSVTKISFDYNHEPFNWGTAPGNVTGIFYTDIYNIYDDAENLLGFILTVNTYYWLRVKVFSELTATKRCFVFCKCTTVLKTPSGNGIAAWFGLENVF